MTRRPQLSSPPAGLCSAARQRECDSSPSSIASVHYYLLQHHTQINLYNNTHQLSDLPDPESTDLHSHHTYTQHTQWTKQRNSSRCRASSSRTAANSSPGAASVRLPCDASVYRLYHSEIELAECAADTLLVPQSLTPTLYSRQARVSAHLTGRRHGILDHGSYWLHRQAQ